MHGKKEPSDESEGETSEKSTKRSGKKKDPAGKNEKPPKKQSSASEELTDESEGETSKKPTKRSGKKKDSAGKNKKPPKKQSSAREELTDESEGETSKKPTKRSGKRKDPAGKNKKPPKKQSSASEELTDESEGETSEKPKRSGKKKEYSMESLDDLEGDLKKTHPKESTDAEAELEVEGEMSKKCCIYTVTKTLADNNNKKTYEPRVVSIGPYHGDEKQVKEMKEHKLQFLSHLLDRKQKSLNDLLKCIRPLAEKASKYYSKSIKPENMDRFLKLMVLDGCFLIELFRKADKKVEKVFERDDPLGAMAWALPYIYGDLLLVGNQIPFFVMEKLFQTSKMPGDSDDSLSLLALKFFNKVMQRPDGVIDKFLNRPTPNGQKVVPLHLLDLVRSSLLLQPDQEETRIAISNSEPSNKRNDLICCISKLCRAGIKLRGRKAGSFLDVKFRKGMGIFVNGVIEMPKITMDYHMKAFLVNCVAFEQLHNTPFKQFTVYARLLDCLVNTAKDVDHLCDNDIFDSYFGKVGDIVQFINKMGKDLAFDEDQFYLSQLFKEVTTCYGTDWKVQWARIKARYFDSPWSWISLLAAILLLLLTLLSTFYTVYAYYVKS